MELLIIRHGQSEADLLGVHEGRADFPLTEFGAEQARRMARHVLSNFPPDLIVSSPLIRARKTAEILQGTLNAELQIEEDLREFNNGVLAGIPKEEALIKYPLPKGGRPVHIPIQDGESMLELRFRSERVLNRIIHDYQSYSRVAVVSHGMAISHLLNAFLKLPVNSGCSFVTGDTGIHLLEIKANGNTVKFLNSLEHLREMQVGGTIIEKTGDLIQ